MCWTLENKKNINGKTDEIQIKSQDQLIVMHQYLFLNFDKCPIVKEHKINWMLG